MGSFFLYKTSSIEEEALATAKKVFHERQLSIPVAFVLNEYTLLLYPKILLPNLPNWRQIGDNYIFVCGTLSYKGLNYSDSIDTLFSDILGSELAIDELRGNCVFLTFIENRLIIYPDRSNIYNIYYNTERIIFSNSLLATFYGANKPAEYDRLSIAENLLTGYLVGPDTFFTHIKRLEPESTENFDHINFSFFPYPKVNKHYPSRKNALKTQQETLDKYVSRLTAFADDYGVDSGITGGHDSRLNMGLIRKKWKNISFHSHFRKVKDNEIKIAEQVCVKANVFLKQVEVKPTLEMTEDELTQNMHDAFFFYDGHVKLHSFYTEGYNTPSYRKRILANNRLGISGIAGELFRNEEGMFLPFWNYSNFIKYKLVYNYSGSVITDTSFEKQLFTSLEDKIKRKLKLNNSKITRYQLKQFLIHVYIPSCLGSRNNAENIISFFLSPFTDPEVASTALSASHLLGTGYTFQQRLICLIDPQLASVTSDYGYDFISGEPAKNRLKKIGKDLMPESFKQKMLDKLFQKKENKLFHELYTKSDIIKVCFNEVKNLHLPIDLYQLVKRPDMAPIIIGIGYFLLQTRQYKR